DDAGRQAVRPNESPVDGKLASAGPPGAGGIGDDQGGAGEREGEGARGHARQDEPEPDRDVGQPHADQFPSGTRPRATVPSFRSCELIRMRAFSVASVLNSNRTFRPSIFSPISP